MGIRIPSLLSTLIKPKQNYYGAHDPRGVQKNVREVYRTTAILSVVTIVEVVGALMYEKYALPAGYPRIVLVFVSVASLIKAYWIMAVFMHVNHEKKGFTLPFFSHSLLILAIIAFSMDGSNLNFCAT